MNQKLEYYSTKVWKHFIDIAMKRYNFLIQALKYFETSNSVFKDEATDIFIVRCKKHLHTNNTTTESPPDPSKESDCQNILNKKDFYDILGVTRSATDEEIKRAYKKLAIKFHPDKNNSPHAADAFKKV